ncbi:hypothetical protein [Kineosporia babensis]|uniref:Uncharacterized protein n=1 Tax=Kineosporia babensis TaxID=499548 RepID=A0A9X1NDS1_9ACTN|nr:hypothetical protein [Kineosporia babensis]MCD5311969.1 hypothetical protein [Kineosporia babensis]
MAYSQRFHSAIVDGRLCAYRLTDGVEGVLEPVRSWLLPEADTALGHAVTVDLQRAYYVTLDEIVALSADGGQVWRSSFEPKATSKFGHWPGCLLSLGESAIWVYRPDAMAGRDRSDQWVVLDSRTGAVIAQADLETAGHGGGQFLHRGDGSVLLDVGEGQDGSALYRGSLTETGMDLFVYPWRDRVLVGFSPDGQRFLTVEHGQVDLKVHAYPQGEVLLSLSLEDFGHGDEEEVYVDWNGGYLDSETVILTVTGEDEEKEWFQSYRVDTRTGEVRGAFDTRTDNADGIKFLGDGTWLTVGPSGHPVRHSDR